MIFLITFYVARSNCTYTCPSDCVATKYDITQSGTPRSKIDSSLLITSLSKKNQELYNLAKDIKSLDDQCITPELKQERIKELEQLSQSIAYESTHLYFFWQHDTMVSHVRDQVYDLWDMIGNDTYSTYFYYSIVFDCLFLNYSWIWRMLWCCNWIFYYGCNGNSILAIH